MGWIVRVTEDTGRVSWLTKSDSNLLRFLGSRDTAEVFFNQDAAKRGIEELRTLRMAANYKCEIVID